MVYSMTITKYIYNNIYKNGRQKKTMKKISTVKDKKPVISKFNKACLVEVVQLIYLSCSIIVSKHCFVRLRGESY